MDQSVVSFEKNYQLLLLELSCFLKEFVDLKKKRLLEIGFSVHPTNSDESGVILFLLQKQCFDRRINQGILRILNKKIQHRYLKVFKQLTPQQRDKRIVLENLTGE